MKNKSVVLTLIICILIAAAGLAYEYFAPGGLFSKRDAEQQTGPDQVMDMSGSSDSIVINRDRNREQMQDLFQKKQSIVIDCLGDSITWGMYSTPELESAIDSGEVYTGYDDGGQMFEDFDIYVSSAYQSEPSYPEVLESELNQCLAEDGKRNSVTTVNDGICGDWIMPWTYQRMTCDPDVVVFLMSGNNFYMNVPLDRNFEGNIEAIQKQGKIIYLANYPLYPGGPLMRYFESANKVISRMAEQYKLPLIDLYTMVDAKVADNSYTWNELYSPDKTHLSVKGYELIGMMITEALYNDIKTN